MNKNINYAVSSLSVAHTYGNVTCFVLEYIKNVFNKEFFKTVHVSSTLAHRQFTRFNGTTKEFLKKSKPIMIIRPRIEIDDEDVDMYDTLLTTRIGDTFDTADFGNLQNFIEDEKKGIYTKFLMNRLKLSFDIVMVFETQLTQINVANFLKNQLTFNRHIGVPANLESLIPRSVIDMIAKDAEIDIGENAENVNSLLDYMNSHSLYPVMYKFKNSSGNDEFFRFYPTTIDLLFSGLTIDDGNKKNQVFDTFTINFTCTTQFSTAGLYYYFTYNKDTIDAVQYDILQQSGCTGAEQLVPIYTCNNIFNGIKLPEGWTLYTAPMFEVEGTQYDLEFEPILNHSIKETISYHLKNNIPVESCINLTLVKNGRIMSEENNEYSIDWDRLVATINNCNSSSQYRFIMHVNALYINNLVADLLDAKDEK